MIWASFHRLTKHVSAFEDRQAFNIATIWGLPFRLEFERTVGSSLHVQLLKHMRVGVVYRLGGSFCGWSKAEYKSIFSRESRGIGQGGDGWGRSSCMWLENQKQIKYSMVEKSVYLILEVGKIRIQFCQRVCVKKLQELTRMRCSKSDNNSLDSFRTCRE